MNVGIIVDNDLNSDVRVRKEIGILQNQTHNIYVLCFAFDGKSYPSIGGINVCRINISKRVKDTLFFFFNRIPVYEWMWKKEIKKFIAKNQVEVLHVHDLYMSKAAFSGIKSAGQPIRMILDLHENYPVAIGSYNWTKGWLRNLLSNPKAWIKKEPEYLGYASKVIVLSESFKFDLLSRYNFLHEENIISFPNVIDLRRFEKFQINQALKKSGKVTLLYFGVVAARRGIFETIEALLAGLSEGLNIGLLIIGPADKADRKRFFDLINRDELKKSVRYIPWIDISELVSYLHISDICLSPLVKNAQHESGVANKIFQYMYGAKPIIASDCKPQKELIESFGCGLVYSTQNEFAACIKRLAKDPGLRERLGENGYQQLYKNYDNEEFSGILLKIYGGGQFFPASGK